jgi:Rrf2 family cysteine metabolism transcriptional repressor
MRLSAMAEYACLAGVALAQQEVEERPLQMHDLARICGIREHRQYQILLRLRAKGLIEVKKRGAGKGYRLSRPAAEITLAQVVEAIDGPIGIDGPAGVVRESEQPSARLLTSVMKEAQDAARNVFEGMTLAYMADRLAYMVDGSEPHDWVI